MSSLDDLRARLGNVILETCNKIGCSRCDLKWEDDVGPGCAAIDLQDQIADLEDQEREASRPLTDL